MHVLCHTHWDREWYQTFQEYRIRLVYQIDRLLDILDENSSFVFHMDGQTSWISDYLEIKPFFNERLKKHIADGRIVIGPWFVMPDELLLSGESIVRNLLLGCKICNEYKTEPMPVGYVTDIFGHISQFPQICRGFNIDNVILHRGTSGVDETLEMFWVGADGSEVMIIKIFPDTGYQDFLVKRNVSDEDITKYEERKLELSATGVMFALDGNDHQPARIDVYEKIDWMNSIFKEIKAIPSNINDFLAELKPAVEALGDRKSELKRFYGELRTPAKEGQWNEVFNGIASARVYLKQRNDACEYNLARQLEMLNSFAKINGNEDQTDFLARAWKYLLLNHPHDSIVGCSQDQVHKDMLYRFDQVDEICYGITWDTINSLDIDTSAFAEDENTRVVTVYNQSAKSTGEITRFRFDVYESELAEKAKDDLIPVLFDENCEQIEFVVESEEKNVWGEPFVKKTGGRLANYLTTDTVWIERRRFNIAAKVSVPEFGYKTFKIGYTQKKALVEETADSFIENEFIKIFSNKNGTVNIIDKKNDRTYYNQGIVEDAGDKGTGWDHFYPNCDKKVYSDTIAEKVKVSVSKNSLSSSMIISYYMPVPIDLSEGRESRLDLNVKNKITTIYKLDKNTNRIDIVTRIKNKAKNHRMRVLYKTGFDVNRWYSDSAFDVLERDIKLMDTTGWKEEGRPETPFKNFMAIKDEKCGFAIITKGLCEGCVMEDEKRTMALTLFRGYSENLYGIWSESSQMIGVNTFEYSIVPFDAIEQRSFAFLLNEAELLKLKTFSLVDFAKAGNLPFTGSFMNIKGDVNVSTLKVSEDKTGYILRLFNTGSIDESVEINFMNSVKNAFVTNLKEEFINSDIDFDHHNIKLIIKAKGVASIYIEF